MARETLETFSKSACCAAAAATSGYVLTIHHPKANGHAAIGSVWASVRFQLAGMNMA